MLVEEGESDVEDESFLVGDAEPDVPDAEEDGFGHDGGEGCEEPGERDGVFCVDVEVGEFVGEFGEVFGNVLAEDNVVADGRCHGGFFGEVVGWEVMVDHIAEYPEGVAFVWDGEEEVACYHVEALRIAEAGIFTDEGYEEATEAVVAFFGVVVVFTCQSSGDVFEDCIDFFGVFVFVFAEVEFVAVGLHYCVCIGELHPDCLAPFHRDAAENVLCESFHLLSAAGAFVAES